MDLDEDIDDEKLRTNISTKLSLDETLNKNPNPKSPEKLLDFL